MRRFMVLLMGNKFQKAEFSMDLTIFCSKKNCKILASFIKVQLRPQTEVLPFHSYQYQLSLSRR